VAGGPRSLNGTYVNEELIGQRIEGVATGEFDDGDYGPCPLEDGDQLAIGGNEFTVVIDEVPGNVVTNEFLRPGVGSEVGSEACLQSA